MRVYSLNGLGSNPTVDDPCTSSWSFSKSVLYKAFGDDYENAVQTVTERLNWNIGVQCYPIIAGNGCYDQSEVGCVINTYYNLAKTGAIPEYDRKNNPSAIPLIEKTVTEKSSRPAGRVAAILFHLYYATMDNSIKSDAMLFPVKSKQNNAIRDIPDEVNSTQKKVENATEGFADLLPYVPYVVGGVALIYVLTLLKK